MKIIQFPENTSIQMYLFNSFLPATHLQSKSVDSMLPASCVIRSFFKQSTVLSPVLQNLFTDNLKAYFAVNFNQYSLIAKIPGRFYVYIFQC